MYNVLCLLGGLIWTYSIHCMLIYAYEHGIQGKLFAVREATTDNEDQLQCKWLMQHFLITGRLAEYITLMYCNQVS